MMLAVMALSLMCSCSKDDDGGTGGGGSTNTNTNTNSDPAPNPSVADIHVVVNEDGTTSNGSLFSAIDDKNFYVDYVKYTVEEGHLVVSGYDKTGFKGVANIVARITYKGNTYEVLKIKKDAFRNCTKVTSVSISNTVTFIDSNAFANCTGLIYLIIGNNVKSIAEAAFKKCSSLTSIIIGNSVTSIEDQVFSGCNALTIIKVEKDNPQYDSRDNCNAIIATSTNTLIMGCKTTIIPNSVTSIGYGAFRDCIGLESLTIPNSVTSIGYSLAVVV